MYFNIDLVSDVGVDRILDFLQLIGISTAAQVEAVTGQIDDNFVIRAGEGHNAQNQSQSQNQRNEFLHRYRILLIIMIYF